MAELEKVGLPGPSALNKMLSSTEDPIESIQKFQKENCIQVSKCNVILF